MVTPFHIALGASALPLLHDVGRAITLPLLLELDAKNRVHTYRFNRAVPVAIPDPATLIEIYNRRVAGGDDPFRAKWVDAALQFHGINLGQTITGEPGTEAGEMDRVTYQVWRQAFELHKHVPGIEAIADARRRDLIDEQTARKMLRRAGADVEKILTALKWGYARPEPAAVLETYARDRIDDQELDLRLTASGAQFADWFPVLQSLYTLPSIGEIQAAANRGIIPTDEQYLQWLRWQGVREPDSQNVFRELRKGIPSVSDLILMGVREGFRPELARVYDYYSEFPELTRPWWGKLGLDYPVGIRENVRGQEKDLTLADIFWASHWHVMPLQSAFAAYQRFRPDRLGKYQAESPNIRPFRLEDLQLHMRLADLPPGVRDWMVALSHPPPTRRDIHWAVVYANKDRAWVQNAWMDLGLSLENAVLQADIEEGRTAEREGRWIASINTRVKRQTVSMIEGLYDDGTIDRGFALRQLSDAGLPDSLSTQLLDIVDFGVERRLVRAAIVETGRDYLSGELSLGDAETQLRRIGVQDSRIRNYLAAWTIRRNRRRKQAETGKIVGWLAAGLLSYGEARARLLNLGWTDPDAALYLSEAQGKLQKRLAGEQKATETAARQRARELERLAKDADAQSRKLRSEANRVAPRSVLIGWMKDGIITEDEFRTMMRERGFPDALIDDYIRDSKVEKVAAPKPTPATATFPRPPGSAHPMAATLTKWFKDAVLTEAQYRQALKDLGYGTDDIERFVLDNAPATNGQA